MLQWDDARRKDGPYACDPPPARRLGVEEYFLHDPRKDYLEPGLQGYRLANGRYQKIVPEPDGSLLSRTTGLQLRREGNHLRLIDPATGTPLPGIQELREEVRRLRRELEARGNT